MMAGHLGKTVHQIQSSQGLKGEEHLSRGLERRHRLTQKKRSTPTPVIYRPAPMGSASHCPMTGVSPCP